MRRWRTRQPALPDPRPCHGRRADALPRRARPRASASRIPARAPIPRTRRCRRRLCDPGRCAVQPDRPPAGEGTRRDPPALAARAAHAARDGTLVPVARDRAPGLVHERAGVLKEEEFTAEDAEVAEAGGVTIPSHRPSPIALSPPVPRARPPVHRRATVRSASAIHDPRTPRRPAMFFVDRLAPNPRHETPQRQVRPVSVPRLLARASAAVSRCSSSSVGGESVSAAMSAAGGRCRQPIS